MSRLPGTFYALSLRLFEMLRQREPTTDGHTLFISSARSEEGKTFTARGIAHCMADLSSDPVLLIDGNLEQPSLHRHYGLINGVGFYDCLASGDAAAATLHETTQANLKIMTVGQARKPGLLFKPQ